MYNTTLLRPKTTDRFSSLMDLYEQNYILMRLLAPGLRHYQNSVYLSEPEGVLPLELSAIEHNRYTTTFKLTYLFSDSLRSRREPNLTIRLYHDARTCEVMSGLIPSRKLELRRTRDLTDGYRLNRFLNKWTSYCLRQGHGFQDPTAESAEPAESMLAFD
jgi:uncharacterized protein YqiB (DUF1249 family)